MQEALAFSCHLEGAPGADTLVYQQQELKVCLNLNMCIWALFVEKPLQVNIWSSYAVHSYVVMAGNGAQRKLSQNS